MNKNIGVMDMLTGLDYVTYNTTPNQLIYDALASVSYDFSKLPRKVSSLITSFGDFDISEITKAFAEQFTFVCSTDNDICVKLNELNFAKITKEIPSLVFVVQNENVLILEFTYEEMVYLIVFDILALSNNAPLHPKMRNMVF